MLAVIDVGNSNVVLGLYDGTALKARLRFRTGAQATADEIGQLMLSRLGPVEDICVSSVVPEYNYSLEQACKTYLGKTPLWVKQDLWAPMPLEIDNPKELGADRLVASYAAWLMHKSAMIVIDMGTATTFDVINSQGVYVGGAISPGLEISKEALFQKASKLNRVGFRNPSKLIGKNTEEHIQIGVTKGYAALIDGLVEGMSAELGEEVKVIATGGLAPLMKQASKTIQIIEPDLILQGLCLLYQEYQRGSSGTRNSLIEDRFKCAMGYQEA